MAEYLCQVAGDGATAEIVEADNLNAASLQFFAGRYEGRTIVVRPVKHCQPALLEGVRGPD